MNRAIFKKNLKNIEFDKKRYEEKILLRFQQKSKLPFKICALNEAKKIYPEYKGETPDLVIRTEADYIGVELASLTADYLEWTSDFENPFHQAVKTGPRKINTLEEFEKAIADRKEAVDRRDPRYLVRQIPIEIAFMSSLENKINKLPEYAPEKIWLLFHADQFHQTGMISTLASNDAAWIADHAYQKIQIPDRIQRVFIFEVGTGSSPILFAYTNRAGRLILQE